MWKLRFLMAFFFIAVLPIQVATGSPIQNALLLESSSPKAVVGKQIILAQRSECERLLSSRGVSERDYPKYKQCLRDRERGAAARKKYEQGKRKLDNATRGIRNRAGSFLRGFRKK